MAVTVVLPVLDEREALPWVLGRIPAGYEPLVVDNGSADGSGELARHLGARVVDEPRRGFGAACWAGLGAATSDVVAFMDCDASLDPQELARVTDPVTRGRADLVLGARAAQRGGGGGCGGEPRAARAARGAVPGRGEAGAFPAVVAGAGRCARRRR